MVAQLRPTLTIKGADVLFGDVREPDQRWACHSSLRAYAELAYPRLGAIGGGGGVKGGNAGGDGGAVRAAAAPPPMITLFGARVEPADLRRRPRASRLSRERAARAHACVRRGARARNPTDFHVVMGYVLSREECTASGSACVEARTNELQGVCVALRGRVVQLPVPVEDTRSGTLARYRPAGGGALVIASASDACKGNKQKTAMDASAGGFGEQYAKLIEFVRALGKGLCQLEEADEARREASLERGAAPAPPVPRSPLGRPHPPPRRRRAVGTGARAAHRAARRRDGAVLRRGRPRRPPSRAQVSAGTISRVARGLNRSAGGYAWRFVGEDAEPRTSATAPVAAPAPAPAPAPTVAASSNKRKAVAVTTATASATKRTVRRGGDAEAGGEKADANGIGVQPPREPLITAIPGARVRAGEAAAGAAVAVFSEDERAWLLGRVAATSEDRAASDIVDVDLASGTTQRGVPCTALCHVIADSDAAENATRNGNEEEVIAIGRLCAPPGFGFHEGIVVATADETASIAWRTDGGTTKTYARKRVGTWLRATRDGWRHRQRPPRPRRRRSCPQQLQRPARLWPPCPRRPCSLRPRLRQPHWLAHLRWAHRSACPQQPLRPAAARAALSCRRRQLHHSPWTSRRRRWRPSRARPQT